MKGPVLLTRPEGPGAQASLRRLQALGWRAIHAPLTRIEPLADPGLTSGALDLEAAQAFVFTSAEGVRRFAALSGFRGRPAHAVGAATAAAARAAGFLHVEEGGGDVRSLAPHLAARLTPGRGPALHFGAAELAGDLPGALAAAGIGLIAVALYRAAPLSRLPEGAEAALREGGPAALLFYAPSAARAFAALQTEARHPLAQSSAIAVSRAAAAPLEALGWRRLIAAPRPDEAHLLGALAALS